MLRALSAARAATFAFTVTARSTGTTSFAAFTIPALATHAFFAPGTTTFATHLITGDLSVAVPVHLSQGRHGAVDFGLAEGTVPVGVDGHEDGVGTSASAGTSFAAFSPLTARTSGATTFPVSALELSFTISPRPPSFLAGFGLGQGGGGEDHSDECECFDFHDVVRLFCGCELQTPWLGIMNGT